MAGIIEDGVVVTRFVAPISILSNQPAFVSDSVSLKRQTLSQNAQRWEITTNLEPSNNTANFLVHSILNGHEFAFQIQMPQVYRQSGKTTSTICTTDIAASAGVTSVSVQNNGRIVKGEFIQFQNHSKVYMVTEDRSGLGGLAIFPGLVQAVPSETAVILGDNVRMAVRYDIDTALGITYTDGILSDPGSVKLIEAL